MDPNHFTEVAAQASERYLTVLATFRSILFGYLNEPFSIQQSNALRAAAVDVGRMYFDAERALIADAVRSVALDALQTLQRDVGTQPYSDIPNTLSVHLSATVDYLESEIRAQLSRDVEMTVRRYREHALDAQLGNHTFGVERTKFMFRDRVGRLYPSQKFIRAVWRQALVVTAAEFYALEASARGIDVLEIVHPDAAAAVAGEKISLSGTTYPSFADVRDEVFHPQSQATLKVVDVPA